MKKLLTILAALLAVSVNAQVTNIRTSPVYAVWEPSPMDSMIGGAISNMTYKLLLSTNSDYSGALVFTNTVYTGTNEVRSNGTISLVPNVTNYLRLTASANGEIESDPVDLAVFYLPPRKIEKPRNLHIIQ